MPTVHTRSRIRSVSPDISTMPSISQSVMTDSDNEPLTWWSSSSMVGRERDLNVEEVYCEGHRLAVEALVAGGVDAYRELLKKERIRNFLSDDEIKVILQTAKIPKSEPQSGDDSSLVLPDANSLVYFPNMSDVDGPSLDIGWPAVSNSKRGATTATAHFQPNFTSNIPVECIYSCKDAARKMIKGAKKVIVIVTDTLTDPDIFQDLQDACSRRRVPVYILLDMEAVPSFLQMCSSLNVRLAHFQKLRVRAVTGFRYFSRSGARITGRIHEQFMLVDRTKVAMGTYRFRWTDGRINTSNLIELTGEVTEQYEEEFQRLYKRSLAINTKVVLPSQLASLTPACMNTPAKAQAPSVSATSSTPAAKAASPAAAAKAPTAQPASRNASTQTFTRHMTRGTQTETEPSAGRRPRITLPPPSPVEPDSSGSDSNCSTPTESNPTPQSKASLPVKPSATPAPSVIRVPGHNQTEHYYYPPSSVVSRADYMVKSLSTNKNFSDWSTLSIRSSLHRGCKAQQSIRPGPGLTNGSILMVTSMRTRYLQ